MRQPVIRSGPGWGAKAKRPTRESRLAAQDALKIASGHGFGFGFGLENLDFKARASKFEADIWAGTPETSKGASKPGRLPPKEGGEGDAGGIGANRPKAWGPFPGNACVRWVAGLSPRLGVLA